MIRWTYNDHRQYSSEHMQKAAKERDARKAQAANTDAILPPMRRRRAR